MVIKNTSLLRRHFILSGASFTGLALQSHSSTPKNILVVGDSLSAEYGLARGNGWVALLANKLSTEKWPYTVVNASISGDTTSGGRSRLPHLLTQHQPSIVVIELGGNDALRGFPLSMTEENINTMTKAAQQVGAKVLLLGMQVPPNYGAVYAKDFAALYARVAQLHKAALVPSFLRGIADDPDPAKWFQADRIHPTALAQPIMLANVWPVLQGMLKRA